MSELTIYLIIINIIAFLLMGWDKYSAINNQWRISENTLLVVSIIGGSLGSLLGMFIFHHKTKKKRFLIGIPLCILLNIYIFFIK